MKAPQKTGFKVNGKPTSLENYLLNIVERPLPKAPTHFVVADVLNTDLSIKRVTIYFNPDDTWGGRSLFEPNTAENVGYLIGQEMSFLNSDTNTLAYKFWVVEVATNQTVWESKSLYTLTKCEL